MEVQIGDHTYLVQAMRNKQARHVLRKLAPTFASIGGVIELIMKALAHDPDAAAGSLEPQEEVKLDDLFQAVGPVSESIAAMSDSDADYIFDSCFAAVRRQTSTGWQSLTTSTGELRYEDVSLPQQMQLVLHVLQETFSDFLPALLGRSNDVPAQGSQLN